MTELYSNLILFSPELVLVGFLSLLFIVDAVFPSIRHSYWPMIIVVLACVCGAVMTHQIHTDSAVGFFSGLVRNDGFAAFFRYVFFFACAMGAYIAFGSKELDPKSRMEYALLIMCVTFGMSLMAISTHLLSLYIGIEIVSIISFVLAGFQRSSLRSNEASLKYLVFGALASGLMIYGFSLLYGITGSLHYGGIARFLMTNQGQLPAVLPLAFVLVYAGLAYKISAFPMHFWTPDVYEGAPTAVATFFSVGPKAAGFAALIRFTIEVLTISSGKGTWTSLVGANLVPFIAGISAATMLIGNLSAIGQSNVKRILAYSSIAHVGYMLMGFVVLNTTGYAAVLFYIVAYCAMNIGAFWVVSVVSDLRGSTELAAFRGLGWTNPTLGICMAVFLFSLTGIPMFSGFIGKFLLFGALIEKTGFLWLAIFGVLNSVVSLYYYAQILRAVWLERPGAETPSEVVSLYDRIGIVGLAIPTVVLGLYFTPVIRFAERTLAAFR